MAVDEVRDDVDVHAGRPVLLLLEPIQIYHY